MENISIVSLADLPKAKWDAYLKIANRNQAENLRTYLSLSLVFSRHRKIKYLSTVRSKRAEKARMRHRLLQVNKRALEGAFPPELSDSGCEITRYLGDREDQHQIQGCKRLYDDAYEFAYADEERLKVYTFCEGSCITYAASDRAMFNKECEELKKHYLES